jgi:flagellar motor switch protein FliN/FliY
LENILGPNGRTFNLEKITDLEARILTGFDNLLYKNFSHLLKPAEKLPQRNTNYNECNLTFFLHNNGKSYGTIVVKVPVVAINPEPISLENETFSINNFLNNTAPVTICAGYSKIKLNDIKTLEKDDIVLLENSKSDQMILKYDGYETVFRVQPNPLLYVDYDIEDDGANSGGNKNMSNNIYNMWDSIQVEIGAEFEKVKLTLGELKQISEGLVVDIGSVYDNKIDLKVEDKIVASGELVIINDRYGVRVNQIFTEEDSAEEPAVAIENNYEPVEESYEETEQFEENDSFDEQVESSDESATEPNEEDFDYSNFDLDDEDL